jgi:UDPglucose 6-dehydrogenase
MSTICILGMGYVGLAYAVALADLGNDVVGLDIDRDRVEALGRGETPLYEPGLDELLERNLAAGRLRFSTDYADAIPGAEFIFLCVGTPSLSSGEADMRQVRSASIAIGRNLAPDHRVVLVNKSTMPIGSGDLVVQFVSQHAVQGVDFAVVANPEFLREGQAMDDIFHPDRIVIGSDDASAAAAVAALYAPLDAPVLYTDQRSAEMVKYAANAFLATKISFINEVAQVCERLHADVATVARGLGMDPRIGPLYLEAGLGFGGSCFPKDVAALARMADAAGLHPQLLRAVMDINLDTRRQFVLKADLLLGGLESRVVAVLGLAFKQDTDDLRESPALDIIAMLEERGAKVRAYDPAAVAGAAPLLPLVTMCANPYEAAEGADAVMVVTPWREFRQIDMQRLASVMRGDLLLDGRNLYDPTVIEEAGLRYAGVGRHGKGGLVVQPAPSSSSPTSLALETLA